VGTIFTLGHTLFNRFDRGFKRLIPVKTENALVSHAQFTKLLLEHSDVDKLVFSDDNFTLDKSAHLLNDCLLLEDII